MRKAIHDLTFRSFLLFLAFVVAGCGGDGPTSTSPESPPKAVIGGGPVGSGGFLLRAGSSGGTGMGFVVQGENMRFEDGALAVDVTVLNDGAMDAPLPAALTLVTLDPDTVRVLGADNGLEGAGASFDLAFAEDDLVWNVGEESLPRTVRFAVAQGTSVAFVVRIDVGMMSDGGSIGGVVFEDLDQDGALGLDESGIVGATIELSGPGVGRTTTITSSEGTYRFDGLGAGLYTVRKLPQPFVASTTPVELQVLLSEDAEGNVGSYLTADFGCLFAPQPPVLPLQVGDRVEVNGHYLDDPDRVIALGVHRVHRDRPYGELRGPVTAVDAAAGILTVMGRGVDVAHLEIHGGGPADACKDRPALDFVVGDRARVRVLDPSVSEEDDPLAAVRVFCWSAPKDQVHGVVESIVFDEEDHLVGFRVLGLDVVVTPSTQFTGGDDDHEDDEDDDDDDNDDEDDDDDDDDDEEDED